MRTTAVGRVRRRSGPYTTGGKLTDAYAARLHGISPKRTLISADLGRVEALRAGDVTHTLEVALEKWHADSCP